MPSIGETIFETSLRQQAQRQAQLAQQQMQDRQDKATAFSQMQAVQDGERKNKDQEHGQALDWAKLKGEAAGIKGQANETYDTPDETNQAEAYRQFSDATTGLDLNKLGQNLDVKRAAQVQAEQQFLQTMGYKVGALGQAASIADQNRRSREDIAMRRRAVMMRGQDISNHNAEEGRILTNNLFGATQEKALGKDMVPFESMKRDLDVLNKFATTPDTAQGPVLGRIPTWMPGMSDDTVNARQAMTRQTAAILHKDSGASASDKERVSKIAEFALSPTATRQQLRLGVQALNEITQRTLAAAQRGYRPDVVQGYQNKGGLDPNRFIDPSSLQPHYMNQDPEDGGDDE